MAKNTVKRDTITHNDAIKVGWTGDECQLAIGLLAETDESTVQQNAISCSAAISVCGEGCGWQSALGLLARWLRAQCSVGPSLATP